VSGSFPGGCAVTEPRPLRAVLLAPDGAIERVLADPPARFLYRSLGQLAAEHPGRVVRADWWDARRGAWRPFAWQAAGGLPGWLQGPDKKRRRVKR
jgi:hypothetical protein